jgi:hypothetical protein
MAGDANMIVQVFSELGQVIANVRPAADGSIDLRHLPSGTYTCRAMSSRAARIGRVSIIRR